MTHDEKIVEAVARAIADHFHKDADFGMDGASAYAARPREFQDTARAAITAFQAEAWQTKMVKLTAEDERLLNKALLASTDVIYPILPVDAGFEAIRDAYVRGATWSLEMGMHYKAAYDYADKKSPPTPNPPASP